MPFNGRTYQRNKASREADASRSEAWGYLAEARASTGARRANFARMARASLHYSLAMRRLARPFP